MTQPTTIDSEKPDAKAAPPLNRYRHHIKRLITPLLFAALLGLYGFQLWYHATIISATIDEPCCSPHCPSDHKLLSNRLQPAVRKLRIRTKVS